MAVMRRSMGLPDRPDGFPSQLSVDKSCMGGSGPTDGPLSYEELQLATRNRGMPLEALRYDITPTGLHYLLVHFDIPHLDADTWRVEIGGNVDRPVSLSLADLQARDEVTVPVTMECAGNGRARLHPRPVSQPWLVEAIGTAEWTGVPLHSLLAETGLRPDTADIVFTGADHGVQGDVEQDYQRSLPPEEALRPQVLLAYLMNGRPLEPQHGAPVRLVVPGWYGMSHVKWLTRIEAVTEPFEGYQQAVAYRYQQDEDDPGRRVSRINVRALMIPPGYPDFMTRRRFVDAGVVVLRGRAWSGEAPVSRVDVGVDGDWRDADLDPPVGEFAWRGWSYEWRAEPGDHELSCRATDAAGHTQPLDEPWNYQGMGNNLVQTVPVTVR
jgi:DMSO/TMAO reductase YedYZ molybdopterin-dependent catalytic subunit